MSEFGQEPAVAGTQISRRRPWVAGAAVSQKGMVNLDSQALEKLQTGSGRIQLPPGWKHRHHSGEPLLERESQEPTNWEKGAGENPLLLLPPFP